MGEWNDEQQQAWRIIKGDEPLAGSPEPIEGKCGARIHPKAFRDVAKFLGIDFKDLPVRYCKKPAGAGTEHKGFGPCDGCLGKTPNLMKKYMPVAMQAELTTLADAYDIELGLDPAPVEAERVLLQNKRMFNAVEKLVLQLPDIVSTDIKGTEKIAPVMELWVAINDQMSKWTQFALKYEISQRRITLEEAIAQDIASAVLKVVMNPILQLTPEQLALIREDLSREMNKLSPKLRPAWAKDLEAYRDEDDIVDAEVVE